MSVEAAETRCIEDRCWEKQAVGHHDRDIGRERGEVGLCLGTAQRQGCVDLQARRSASTWTGERVNSSPRRPAGRGGCV